MQTPTQKGIRMAAEPTASTNHHLGSARKRALRERARRRATRAAEELRLAVDKHLCGTMPEAMALLDEAATQAAAALQEMTAMLEATNRRAEAVFAELARTNAGGASAGGHLAVLPR